MWVFSGSRAVGREVLLFSPAIQRQTVKKYWEQGGKRERRKIPVLYLYVYSTHKLMLWKKLEMIS